MEIYQKPTKKFGVRHLQTVLLFGVGIIGFGLKSSMSVAIIVMTDTQSNNSNAEYVQTFDWDPQCVDLILSSLNWGSVVAQIPFGMVIMRYSAQKVMTSSLFVSSLAYLLIPLFANTFDWIGVLGCTVMVGLGTASLELCQHSFLSRWAPPSEQTRLSSFVFSGGNLGNAISMIFSGILGGSRFGWTSIFYIFGGVSICWSILFHFLSANSPSEHSRISVDERRYIESSLNSLDKRGESKKAKFPLKAVVKSLPVWAFIICFSGDIFNLHMLLTELPMFMKKSLGFEIEKSGSLSALPFLVKFVLALPLSWLCDFGLKHGLGISLVRKLATTLGMWGPAAALLGLCYFQPNSRIVIVAIFVLAVGLNAGILSGVLLNAIDLCPNYAGTLFGMVSTVGKAAGALAPIVCGMIVTDQTDIVQWCTVFYIVSALYFFPNLVFIIFGRAVKQPWNDPNYFSNEISISETYNRGIEKY